MAKKTITRKKSLQRNSREERGSTEYGRYCFKAYFSLQVFLKRSCHPTLNLPVLQKGVFFVFCFSSKGSREMGQGVLHKRRPAGSSQWAIYSGTLLSQWPTRCLLGPWQHSPHLWLPATVIRRQAASDSEDTTLHLWILAKLGLALSPICLHAYSWTISSLVPSKMGGLSWWH